MLPISANGQQALVLRRPSSDYFEHYWCDSLAESVATYYDWLEQQNQAGADIYFTTGGFSPVASALEQYKGRKQDNCVEQRSLFLDIDAKDMLLGTVQECKVALVRFIESSGLEMPSTVIDTGGGLHAYWLCDEAIPLPMWQAMADTLKVTTQHFDLACDTQCTVDRCRVLRVPGFVNHKHGKVVDVFWPQEGTPEVFTLEALAQMLTPFFDLAPPVARKQQPQASIFAGIDFGAAATDMEAESAFGDVAKHDVASWVKLRDASLRGDGCKLLGTAMQRHAEVKYGLWTGLLSLVRHTDDEHQGIMDTCGAHPEFDMGTCQSKAASFDGPRRCETLRSDAIDSGFADPCAGCKFAGKIGSPVTLGQKTFMLKNETQIVEQQVTVQEQQADGTVAAVVQTVQVERRALPFPYCRVQGTPGVFVKVKQELPGGGHEWVTSEHPLMAEDIGVTMVRSGVDGVVAMFEYVHAMQGTQKFSIPMAALASSRGDAWPTVLTDHFVNMSRAAIDPLWRASVSKFLQDIVHDYTQNVKAAETVAQFGPVAGRHTETFVLGNVCYAPNTAPTQIVLADSISSYSAHMASPPGNDHEREQEALVISKWNEGLRGIIGHTACSVDQFVLMTGLACPMAAHVIPSRQRGGLIAVHSSESGAGKTSLVSRAINMFVAGENALVEPNTTVMAFLERTLAPAGALPVVWDEASKGTREKAAGRMQELALSSTDRKPRKRLTGEQTDVSWQSWFYTTSNQDIHELITHVSEAETGAAARVLSVRVAKARFGNGTDMVHAQNMAGAFDAWAADHGNVIGRKWVEHFMQNLPKLRERYAHWQMRLAQDCPSTFEDGAMRFVVAIVAATMTAAEEAAAIGLHPFNVNSIYAYAVTLLEQTTESTKGAVMHDDDILNEMLRTSVDVTLIRQSSGVSLSDRMPTKEVAIRVEVDGSKRDVFIAPAYAKEWCKAKGLSYSTLSRQMDALGAVRQHKRMTTGTSLPESRVYAYMFTQHITDDVAAPVSSKEVS